MSRSLRTIPAGALAACAVVLLTSPQAVAVAAGAGRQTVTAPHPAVSARPQPSGRPASGDGVLDPPPVWGTAEAGRRVGDEPGTDPGGAAAQGTDHVWGRAARAAEGHEHRRHHHGPSVPPRPHGAPGKAATGPSGVPGLSPDGQGEGPSVPSGDDGGLPQAVDGPDWPAPVAPPADPLLDSEVWRPAGPAQDQALERPSGRAAGRTVAEAPAAPVLPVLTFGAGLTSLGLGIAFFALRLRRG